MSSYISVQCSFCRSCISTGERWVREKAFGTEFAVGGATYDWYHADVFAGQERSCWEKHELQRETARMSRAA